MQKNLVSIIIPCYNYGKYLACAIRSALGQTYKNIEIIVVDDGSKDNSVEIARKYRVKLIRLKHSGLAKVVDAGVKASNGEFIAILSADDMFHPDFVKETAAVLKKKNVAYAYTQAIGFGADNFYFVSSNFDLKTLLKKPAYFPGSAFIRKSAYLEVDGYDASLPYQEDWDFWLKLAEKRHYGVLVPKPLLFYRQHTRNKGRRRAWIYLIMRWKLRRRHAALFSRNLGVLDWLDIFISDCMHFAYMMARDIFTFLRIWTPVRKSMVKAVAALQPSYAYANEIPESYRRLIKKMDSESLS